MPDIATIGGVTSEAGGVSGQSATLATTVTVTEETENEAPEFPTYAWRGILGLEGAFTSDKRLLLKDEIGQRDLPLPFRVQLQSKPAHEDAVQSGRIEGIDRVPVSDFASFLADQGIDPSEFPLGDAPSDAVVIWATGELNGEHADTAKQYLENGAGVSLDLPRDRTALIDPDTMKEVDPSTVDPFDILMGKYVEGIGGKIGGATIVDISAFEQARVRLSDGVLVASAFANIHVTEKDDGPGSWFYVGPKGEDFQPKIVIASAGPVKPPTEWFQNPQLTKLTALQITKEGRVFGHLADWNGCHVGFGAMCVPPYASTSDYAYFNVGEIETAEGELIPCGKIMFSMDGAGHASTDPQLSYEQIMRYYDDATKVGAFVRAGADRHGTWLAGALRSGLTELEIQHLRTHPPSGDWRPIRGVSDLIAAFSVPIPGYPIARQGHALVASAGGEISAIITAPLIIGEEEGFRRRKVRRKILTYRMREALGLDKTRAEMRRDAIEFAQFGPWDDGLEEFASITAEQRRQWAKSGVALPDGSYPITKCSGAGTSAENARRAIGRAPAAKRPRVRSHIASRERALGCKSSD